MPVSSIAPKFLTRRASHVGAFVASWGMRAWMRTLDYRGLYHDPLVDPIHDSTTTRIYVFWHEFILAPLYLRGHCGLTMLLSKHRDADILGSLAQRMGFECIRGSTYNGAAAAIRELTRCGKHRHLAITPDGPRGPRRELAQGPIFLASRMQLPIVALGFGADRPWRVKSWDRFAVPRPFSRIRAVVSEELAVPPALSREGIEFHRQRVERRLNQLTLDAEEWASSGAPRPGEVRGRREGRSSVAA